MRHVRQSQFENYCWSARCDGAEVHTEVKERSHRHKLHRVLIVEATNTEDIYRLASAMQVAVQLARGEQRIETGCFARP
jgi:hypothetical protein